MNNRPMSRLTWMITVAMLGAMAFMLMYFGEIYVPPFQSFLKYDPGDVPAVVAGLSFGPVAGVTVQVLKGILFFISGKSTAGWVGVLANVLAGSALVIASALVQRLLERAGLRSWFWGLLSAGAGTVIMALLLIPLNATLVYPVWGMKGAAAWSGALYISTPFNLFKGFLSSVISLAFYRRLQPYLSARLARRTA